LSGSCESGGPKSGSFLSCCLLSRRFLSCSSKSGRLCLSGSLKSLSSSSCDSCTVVHSQGLGHDLSGPHLHEALLLVPGLRVAHCTCLIVNCDQGPVSIYIAVGATQVVPIPGLLVGDVGLLPIICHFELESVHRPFCWPLNVGSRKLSFKSSSLGSFSRPRTRPGGARNGGQRTSGASGDGSFGAGGDRSTVEASKSLSYSPCNRRLESPNHL